MLRGLTFVACLLLLLLSAVSRSAIAQSVPDVESTHESRVAARFLDVLNKRPRKGTALDRVYGHHVERGTLDQLLVRYQRQLKTNPKDGSAWMVLGLLEAQRGRDATAVRAFREADKIRRSDPLAAYYLGQALVLVGQPDKAAIAFERAIARRPKPADLLQIFQTLGRMYQRSHQFKQALAVWDRLEKQFPRRERVQESIASILADEGQLRPALARYSQLARKSRDRYRQVQYGLKAASLKVRLGKRTEALADYERIVGSVNPRSWLYRQVRNELETVFLRSDDYAGLSKYYQKWVQAHPSDVNAMTRLAHALAVQGRTKEAERWYRRVLQVAPSNKRVRRLLIDQLVRTKRLPDAIQARADLDKVAPNDPDNIRGWGELILAQRSKPLAERRRAAAAVWRRLVEARPRDALVIAQVADLFREANMKSDAIKLYQRAIALAPKSPQYREYLGEYYHTLNRGKDALRVWQAIAAGANRTPANLIRLAEVTAGFGYPQQALTAMQQAVAMDGRNLNSRLALAQLFQQQGKFDDAHAQLEAAEKLADSHEDRATVLSRQIQNLRESKQLDARIRQLLGELTKGERVSASRWHRLAMYYHAAGQPAAAIQAIQRALKLERHSVVLLTTAATILETGGRLADAVGTYRRLAEVDRRYRTQHWMQVANLEMRLGRQKEAIAAGQRVLSSAPGNPQHYRFFADLCFQLGKTKQGLDALRRSVRVNPESVEALQTLARALAEQFQTDEAIELYWRAFARAGKLDARLSVVAQLSELYLRGNRLDRLIERLRRHGREGNRVRESALLLSRAYQSAGDLGNARSELARLLGDETRDTKLLDQLSQLAEAESEYVEAAKFQRRLHEIAPNRNSAARLAQLYLRAGEIDEAEATWRSLLSVDRQPRQILRAIDSLLGSAKYAAARAIAQRFVREHPNHWEIRHRQAMIAVAEGQPKQAQAAFQALLKLPTSDDALSEERREQGERNRRSTRNARTTMPSLGQRIDQAHTVRSSLGFGRSGYYSYGALASNSSARVWTPTDFGQARMAALGWLYRNAERKNRLETFKASLSDLRGDTTKRAKGHEQWRARVDWLYLQHMIGDVQASNLASRSLSRSPQIAAKWLYIRSLRNRPGQTRTSNSTAGGPPSVRPQPLPKAELRHLEECYAAIERQRPKWAPSLVTLVANELEFANRASEAEQLVQKAVNEAQDLATIAAVMPAVSTRGNVQQALQLLARVDKLSQTPGSWQRVQRHLNSMVYSLSDLMARRAQAKALGDVARVLEHYLKISHIAGGNRSQYGPGASGRVVNVMVIKPGKKRSFVRLEYPRVNRFYDQGGLQLLRNAYEHYSSADVLTDLIARLERTAKSAGGRAAAGYRLGVCYLQWWAEDKAAAAKSMEQAVALLPGDADLKLDLAQLRQTLGDSREALAIVDRVDPLDQRIMKRRETFALNLAVITGNITRARQAATRLFGLRLDSQTQLQLASQMHRFGMHRMAEGVLARVRRTVGNRQSMLLSLMAQYQQQGNVDTAIEIAHQVLRRSTQSFRGSVSFQTAEFQRRQAVQLLARSGRIQSLIGRAEKQLAQAPKSVRLNHLLADYYSAAGDSEKSLAAFRRLSRLRPQDARLQFQIAERLYSSGNRQQSVDFFLAAIRREPALFSRSYYRILSAFRSARRSAELGSWVETTDVRLMGRYYAVSNVARDLLRRNETRKQGLRLFKRAWSAFPNQRANLLYSLYDQRMWEMPETYEYARQVLIPQPAVAERSPWMGMDQVISASSDGRATGVLTRVLQIAGKQNNLIRLRQDVESTLKKAPKWAGGQAMLAIMDAKAGNYAAASKRVNRLLRNQSRQIPPYAAWLIGQELEDYDQLQPVVLQLYRNAVDPPNAKRGQAQFNFSASQRYIKLLKRLGRVGDARVFLNRYSKRRSGEGYYYDSRYESYQRVNNAVVIGAELQKLGYPVDAIRLYSELISNPATMDEAVQFGGDYLRRQIESALKNATRSLTGSKLALALKEFTSYDVTIEPSSSQEIPTVDLVLSIKEKDLDKVQITSLFETATTAARQNPALLKVATASLQKLQLRAKREDVTLTVARVLLSAASDKSKFSVAVEDLERRVKKAPLDHLRAGVRPNARQRQAAAELLPIWLVARQALRDKQTRQAGARLADVALEAASRQNDKKWLFAILRERGQLALDYGDRQAAELYWTRMLDQVLAKKPQLKLPRPGRGQNLKMKGKSKGRMGARPGQGDFEFGGVPTLWQALFGQIAAPAPVALQVRTTGISSLNRFGKAMQIARMAARHRMSKLSLGAVGATLGNGPPIPLSGQVNREAIGQIRTAGRNSLSLVSAQTSRQVEEKLFELSDIWVAQRFPAKDVYHTLVDVVLPKTRVQEVFLYERPLSYGVTRPRSGGRLLVEWALRAKSAGDLRTRLKSRVRFPRAELPANVLLVHLDFASGRFVEVSVALRKLAVRVRKDRLANTAELVCHVAIPALHQSATVDAALPIVAQATQNMVRSSHSNSLGELLVFLARLQFRRNKPTEAKDNLRHYLAYNKRRNSQYAGDYGLYKYKQQLQTVIRELAIAGQTKDALSRLGEYADISTPRWDRNLALGSALNALSVRLRELPMQQRYALLKEWSFPTVARHSVRIVGGFQSRQQPSPRFSRVNPPPPFKSLRLTADQKLPGVVSSADLLLEAAKSLGKLKALESELRPLVARKIENAREMLLLVELAERKASVADIRRYAASVKKGVPRQNDYSRSIKWTDYLVARNSIKDQKYNRWGRSIARSLIEHSKRTHSNRFRQHLRRDLFRGVAIANNDPGAKSLDSGLLKNWVAADYATASSHADGDAAAMWVANSGHIASLTGPTSHYLYFQYPLTGTFSIVADVYDGGWAEGGTAYAGLTYEPLGYTTRGYIFPIGRHERLGYDFPYMKRGRFNRVKFLITPDQVKFVLNGQPCYVDKRPSPTSPWFGLYSDAGRKSFFRHIQFKGQPVIPRSVPLSHGSRLRGWVANLFKESQPKELTTSVARAGVYAAPVLSGFGVASSQVPPPRAPTDWSSHKGVIVGRQVKTGVSFEPQQSLLCYHRPLLDGDEISYDFRYVPQKQAVHPSVGRVAFLISPQGVKLHWITDGANHEWSGLTTANTVAATSQPRPKLRANDWNHVQLSLRQGHTHLRLNGLELGKWALPASNDHLFGLFHYKDRTEARVRNVVLTGNWPKKISNEQLNRLALARTSLPRSQRIIRNQSVTDPIIGRDSLDVYRQAVRLTPTARYVRLKSWVLPHSEHWTHRVYATFAPHHPAKRLSELRSSQLVAPSLLLVDTAKELGKLTELQVLIEKRKFRALDRRREQKALLALVAIARQDAQRAIGLLGELEQLLKATSKSLGLARRWPFIVVLERALAYQPTRATAARMVEYAVDIELANGTRYGPRVERYLRQLQARHNVVSMPSFAKKHFKPLATSQQWFAASQRTSRSNGDGYPVGQWVVGRGELRFLSGADVHLAYLQTPLEGNFEVRAKVSTHNWHEMDLFAGGLYSSLRADRKTVALGNYDRDLTSRMLMAPLPLVGQWCDYRVVVKDQQYTAYVDGRQIHTRRLPAHPDPWVALRTEGRFRGGVQNLRVLGTPRVPRQLNLSHLANLSNWDPTYYTETTGVANAQWQKRGELIVGRRYATFRGSHHQSLLRYHRPMFEDGEIEFEFYCEPGKFMVHPTLGRTAFLIGKQGIRLHQLTDAAFDRSGLSPNNNRPVSPQPSANVPLRKKSWNRVKLAIRGKKASVHLNGQVVYVHEISPSNSRHFGLFHFADRSEARVRQVTYRGDWPQKLPTVEQQELAHDVHWVVRPAKHLTARLAVQFAQTSADSTLQLHQSRQPASLQRDKAGLFVNVTAKQQASVDFRTPFKVRGDFDVTAEYDRLSASQVDNQFGGGVDLHLAFTKTGDLVSMERRTVRVGHSLKPAHGVRGRGGKIRWHVPVHKTPEPAGRMRLVREGERLFYLYAPHRSDRFRILNQRTVGAGEVDFIGLRAGSRAAGNTAQVRLRSLTIAAEQFVPRKAVRAAK